MATLTREQAVRKIQALPIGDSASISGTEYFRIDADEFKVYPPGTTDLDDGAFFVPVEEIEREIPKFEYFSED
jgi:hypothetical protein